jgi:hypothetical protein
MLGHRCFISYHPADQKEVDCFIDLFDPNRNFFISKSVDQEMADDIINNTNRIYVMKRIRELYLSDSTITIVLMGKCTWACRYVDWEIQTSLHSGDTISPNGLLGIKLSSFTNFPKRINDNLVTEEEESDCYARWIDYPCSDDTLAKALEKAFKRRSSHINWINNSKDKFIIDRTCI